MRVQIKDLRPNPYRDMKRYPIDKDKIQSLVSSMEQTGFWDNILGRKVEGIIQIAYGHHRLEALKQIKSLEDFVDIPVKDLDDSTMIQIMANENMEQWESNSSVIIETVKVARDFLNAELGKYETWEEFKTNKNNSLNYLQTLIMESEYPERTFQISKSKGVGQTTILNFLGKNWKQSNIQSALNTLDSEEVEREAVEKFDNMYQGGEFKKAIKTLKKEGISVSKEAQIELAKKVKQRVEDTKGKGFGGGKLTSPVQSIVRQEVQQLDEYDANIKDLELEMELIVKSTEQLATKIGVLNGKIHSMGVQNIKSFSSLFIIHNFEMLFTNAKVLANYFGFNLNKPNQGGIKK
jgi:hypothetical protein